MIVGNTLLREIRTHLCQVKEVCESKLKPTNVLRELMSSLAKGRLLLAFITWEMY